MPLLLIELEAGSERPFDWPNCSTPDCENLQCLWANTGLCCPCSTALLGDEEMDQRFRAIDAD